MESGSLAGEAFHPDFPGVFLDDPVGHRKSETRAPRLAFARRVFGGEEGVVNLVDVLRRNTGAGVADAHVHAGPVRPEQRDFSASAAQYHDPAG